MTSGKPTCDHCAVVIGVYEPIIAVRQGLARQTSRAVEPAVRTDHGELYHRACYEERFGSPPAHDTMSRTGSF